MNAFGSHIYENFIPREYEIFGWNSTLPYITAVIKDNKPLTVIEVGTWKGLSAILMGNEMKKYTDKGKIYCVDTWLGNVDFWYSDDKQLDLKLINGYPSVYYNFISNVKHQQLTETIIPVPLPSNQAFKVLKNKLNLVADVIYIDGSHEKEDVYSDVCNYYNLLKYEGVMFGDDIVLPQVKEALDQFCYEHSLSCTIIDNNFWSIKKY